MPGGGVTVPQKPREIESPPRSAPSTFLTNMHHRRRKLEAMPAPALHDAEPSPSHRITNPAFQIALPVPSPLSALPSPLVCSPSPAPRPRPTPRRSPSVPRASVAQHDHRHHQPRNPPSTALADLSCLNRASRAVAAAALAAALAVSHPHSICPPALAAPLPADQTAAEAPPAEVFSPSKLSTAEKKALKEQSQRNTRAAGRVSQQFSLARRQEAAGDLDGALDTYNQIVQAAPDFAPAYSNRANIFASRRKFDNALTDYERSLVLAPLDVDSWVIYVNRGVTKLARGDDPYSALEDMNIANELRANSPVVLSNRAGVYEMLSKYDSAIRDYQNALDSNDVQPFWNRYGLILFQRNKPTEALSILKRVAARFDVSDVHAAMAMIYFDRGDLANAETEWSKVDRPRLFASRKFLEKERKWPPRAIEVMDNFQHLQE